MAQLEYYEKNIDSTLLASSIIGKGQPTNQQTTLLLPADTQRLRASIALMSRLPASCQAATHAHTHTPPFPFP